MTATSALGDLVVLDLSHALAGPFASTMLGDYGAEIIKIEPLDGEIARAWGPPFYGGESPYFVNLNRNKKSVALDLKHPEGKALFFRLLERRRRRAREPARRHASAKLGIDYERARERQPRIIYCSDLRVRPGRPVPRSRGARSGGAGGKRDDEHHRRARRARRARRRVDRRHHRGHVRGVRHPGGAPRAADHRARAVHRRLDARGAARDSVGDDWRVRRGRHRAGAARHRLRRAAALSDLQDQDARHRDRHRQRQAVADVLSAARPAGARRRSALRDQRARATRTGRRWSRRCRRRFSRRATKSGKRSCCRPASRWGRSTRSTRSSRTRRSARAARIVESTHPVAGDDPDDGAAGADVGHARAPCARRRRSSASTPSRCCASASAWRRGDRAAARSRCHR